MNFIQSLPATAWVVIAIFVFSFVCLALAIGRVSAAGACPVCESTDVVSTGTVTGTSMKTMTDTEVNCWACSDCGAHWRE